MSILKESGGMQRVCCDECGAEHDSEFHERKFTTMIEAIKEDGWQIVQLNSEWRHYCNDPACDITSRPSKLERAKRLFGIK